MLMKLSPKLSSYRVLPDPSHRSNDGKDFEPPPVRVGGDVHEDVVLVDEALEVVAHVEADNKVEEQSSQMVPDHQR